MTNATTIVISDLHLGSKFCLVEDFFAFMARLRPGVELVLNGDTVNYIRKPLSTRHDEALRLLADESEKRRLVWVYGNHDDAYSPEYTGRIVFCRSYNIGKRLFISHGFDFDNIMPYNKAFIIFFRTLHHLRIALGAQPVHVAYYAKKFRVLYNVLRKNVAMNAAEHARENRFTTVTCGHTHYVEDRMMDGIRYVNTGSWTERPVMCLAVTPDEIKLMKIDDYS